MRARHIQPSAKKVKLGVDDAAKTMLAAMQGKRKVEATEGSKKRPAAAGNAASKPKAASEPKAHTDGAGRPRHEDEKSRSQILFRTGLKGVGQSTRIPYKNAAEKTCDRESESHGCGREEEART